MNERIGKAFKRYNTNFELVEQRWEDTASNTRLNELATKMEGMIRTIEDQNATIAEVHPSPFQ